MDFSTQVTTISPDQLDLLFSATEATPVPGAESLVTTKTGEDDVPIVSTQTTADIPIIDVDKLGIEDEGGEGEGEKSKEGEGEKSKPKEGEEDITKPEPDAEEVEQIKAVLKNTTSYLIEKGIWKDFDGREDLDIDEETYAELAAKQEEARVSEMFDELIDSTGMYGKAIINHIRNNGNPDEIIDIFKEQKALGKIDLTDENGQVSVIQKYYSEVVGWNKTKIDRLLNTLKSEDEGLENEAKEAAEKFDKIYQEQLQQVEREHEQREVEKKRQQEQYINTLVSTIDSQASLTDNDKKLVKDSLLKYNKKLPDGTPVNNFFLKFNEIQRDPKQYVELIHFIMDRDGYDKKVSQKTETKATDKTWSFVKGNAAVTKKGSQTPSRDSSKLSKIDFSGVLRNK